MVFILAWSFRSASHGPSENATDHVTERDGLFVRNLCAVGAANLVIRVSFHVSSWKGLVGSSTRVRVWLE